MIVILRFETKAGPSSARKVTKSHIIMMWIKFQTHRAENEQFVYATL